MPLIEIKLIFTLILYLAAAAAKSLQSCPTVWPQRQQPTRLPRPWDSPGKNTGVDCHFLLQCMKVKSERLLSCVWLLTIPRTAPYHAPPSMGFARQEYLLINSYIIFNSILAGCGSLGFSVFKIISSVNTILPFPSQSGCYFFFLIFFP